VSAAQVHILSCALVVFFPRVRFSEHKKVCSEFQLWDRIA